MSLPRDRLQDDDVYNAVAMAALMNRPEFDWLVPPQADVMTGTRKLKKSTVISALGRLGDDDAIQACARHICQERMTTREALAFIRRYRFGLSHGNVDA